MIDLDALQNLIDGEMARTVRVSILSGLSPVTGLCDQFGVQSIDASSNGVARDRLQSVRDAAPADYAANLFNIDARAGEIAFVDDFLNKLFSRFV